ncbi:coiled-coil domain-containing protein 103-like isoform X2 [Salvelinus fontinalis]|uniref:coiled-coil domain-containing protein 103-like isoform X2 n=1 Tax=Salvelinus fontinalis TaxID=8038 RepID=UPI00248674CE|nr:coiled-coil domain-containing protein 103-like isoform X2 [Salvelinus fontinalis]
MPPWIASFAPTFNSATNCTASFSKKHVLHRMWRRRLMTLTSIWITAMKKNVHQECYVFRMEDSPEVINFSALEWELQSAVEADNKYQRENDAKFRALHQKVGTYEEFRDIVLASHLKPLDRMDKAEAPRKQPWNAVASTDKGQNHTSCDEIGLKPQLSEFQPRTASEFSRDWRRFGSDKYSLLLSLGGEGLRDIFRAEVGFGLLGEFLVLLSSGLQPGDEATVIGVLEGLSNTPRFGINMSLLSRAEREACGELFQNLKASAAGNSSVRGFEGDVVVRGSSVEEIKETRDAEAETLFPGPASEAAGRSTETEPLYGIMQLYGVQTVSPPQ